MDFLSPDGHTSVSDCVIDQRENVHHGEEDNENITDLVKEVHDQDVETLSIATNNISFEGDIEMSPESDLQFESHELAYKYYQEYAKSMGFTTSIKNSRRSKKSRDFIDAKFACSRYGSHPESDTASRRSSVKKTDCKASMHVKRNKCGKWVIHEFIKDHNHELLPALAYYFRVHGNVKLVEKNNIDILHAVSERAKKMYVDMSKQSAAFPNLGPSTGMLGSQLDKGNLLVLEEGDAQFLLDYFMCVKKENPKFFYAIDLDDKQYLRNILWVDAKSRSDYVSFSDAVSVDTSYIRTNEKLPLVLFVGVNNHHQAILLGCALVSDCLTSTIVWLMKTWLRAMGGNAPNVILTDQHPSMKSAIEEVLPNTRHCFHLCDVLEKILKNMSHIIKRHGHFVPKFKKCIFKSSTEEQFELRWWKMVGRFDLQEDEWFRSLYEDRKKWIPFYVGDTFLAGLSSVPQTESVNSFFDKYLQRKLTLKEFVKQYGLILQNRYEEEAIADFDTWHKQPALKSPSPWEKQMSTMYTHAIFKKFQVEVLGVVGCHPKKELEDGNSTTYRVEDCEKDETFFVSWDEEKSQVSCLCRSFEYKGFLCRHAMLVLQICGISSIPTQYILRRWTKDAKTKQLMVEGTRAQRYVALSKQGIELSEEGSLTQESHNIALRALVDALKNCISVNNTNENAMDIGNVTLGPQYVEGFRGNMSTKKSKRRNNLKKRRVSSESILLGDADHENLHRMDNLGSDGAYLNDYYGSQHTAQGLDHMDFRSSTSFSYSLEDEHNLRCTELNRDASR